MNVSNVSAQDAKRMRMSILPSTLSVETLDPFGYRSCLRSSRMRSTLWCWRTRRRVVRWSRRAAALPCIRAARNRVSRCGGAFLQRCPWRLYGEPSNLGRLEDVPERDPTDTRYRVDPEFVVREVQHVF